MTWIALDSSGGACSIAVARSDGSMHSRTEVIGRGHAAHIGSMLAVFLREHDVDASQLTGVVAGIGPGSFTGIRVGLAASKGLCVAAGCGLMAVDSFRAHRNGVAQSRAGQPAPGKPVIVCLHSGRGDVFMAGFATPRDLGASGDEIALPPTIARVEDALDLALRAVGPNRGLIVTGDAAAAVYKAFPGRSAIIDVRAVDLEVVEAGVVEAAWLLFDRDQTRMADPGSVVPLYLRDASVKRPASDG